jgi:hypothetical protein
MFSSNQTKPKPVHTLELVAPESESETESETEREKVRGREKNLFPDVWTPLLTVRLSLLPNFRFTFPPADKYHEFVRSPSTRQTLKTNFLQRKKLLQPPPSSLLDLALKVNAGKR